jgi:hypothetical protein
MTNQIPITMPLAQRLLLAAERALVPHTPGDEHTHPAARKAVLAVLDQLTRTASPDLQFSIRTIVNDLAATPPSGGDAAHPVATGHTAVVEDEGCGWWAAICQTGCGHLYSFDFEADAQDAADRHRADSIRPAGPVVPLTGPLAPDTTKEA